jgi:hypothetical protein
VTLEAQLRTDAEKREAITALHAKFDARFPERGGERPRIVRIEFGSIIVTIESSERAFYDALDAFDAVCYQGAGCAWLGSYRVLARPACVGVGVRITAGCSKVEVLAAGSLPHASMRAHVRGRGGPPVQREKAVSSKSQQLGMPLLTSAAKFDRATGKPLNDAAKQLRAQQVKGFMSGGTPGTHSGGSAAYGGGGGATMGGVVCVGGVPMTGTIRQQMHLTLTQTHPQVSSMIEEVVNYNAHQMSGSKCKITFRMMMIGPPGAGKSSYVNTARAVFSGKAWTEDAEVGMGHDTVTEVASSYPLLPENPDHIRFTDTRGWIGPTDEAVGFFADVAKRNIDHPTADMMSFEDVEQKTKIPLDKITSAFNGVNTMHHVAIFFIDAHAIIRQPSTLPRVLDEIVTIYSSLKNSSSGAFEPVFFITKVDRVRHDIPTWELRAFVQEIVSRINQHSQQKWTPERSLRGGEAPAGPPRAPLIVRPNQFHEIRSCGSREEYEQLVHSNQWIEVQRLHASALAAVLPRASALIRKELLGEPARPSVSVRVDDGEISVQGQLEAKEWQFVWRNLQFSLRGCQLEVGRERARTLVSLEDVPQRPGKRQHRWNFIVHDRAGAPETLMVNADTAADKCEWFAAASRVLAQQTDVGGPALGLGGRRRVLGGARA